MLTRRSLTLDRSLVLTDGPLLRREIFADSLLAGQLLTAARAEADSLLADAREHAALLRENARQQARAEVWRQADELLAQWQRQREQMWASIVVTAEALVGDVLQRLLGEQTEAARISAVVRQLAAAQPEDEEAVLYCHPDWLETATQVLQQTEARWTVRIDPRLAGETLCLRTEQGDFSLGWAALGEAFK